MLTPEILTIVLLGVILVLVASVAFRIIEMRSRMGTLFFTIEAKLDLLLKQANITFDPYANAPLEVSEALRAGERIKAVKSYMQSTGVALKEANEFIKELERRSGVA